MLRKYFLLIAHSDEIIQFLPWMFSPFEFQIFFLFVAAKSVLDLLQGLFITGIYRSLSLFPPFSLPYPPPPPPPPLSLTSSPALKQTFEVTGGKMKKNNKQFLRFRK